MLDSSDTVTVSGGQFTVNIQGGMPKIYHPADSLEDDHKEGGEPSGQSRLDQLYACVFERVYFSLQVWTTVQLVSL